MVKKAIKMNPSDTVATSLDELEGEDIVCIISPSRRVLQELKVRVDIPFGHKLALTKMSKGNNVIKFGEVIGVASQAIEVGEYVHVHNVDGARV